MRLIFKTGVLVLTLAAMAVSAHAGKLENAGPEGADISKSLTPAAAEPIHVPSTGDRSFRTEEVVVILPSKLAPKAVAALARHHRLTHLESQSVRLLGKTIHRWEVADGRSIPDIILELERDVGIEAQPNNVYTLQ
jgi:hypothetical protein